MTKNIFLTGIALAGLTSSVGLAQTPTQPPEQPKASSPGPQLPPQYGPNNPMPKPVGQPVGVDGQRTGYADVLKSLRNLDSQTVEPTEIPPTLSLEELRKGQLAWREKFKELFVTFELKTETKHLLKSEQHLQKQGRLVAADYAYRLTFAWKGEKRYVDYRDITPSTTVGRTSEVLNRPSEVATFNGEQSRRYEPSRLLGTVKGGKEGGMENNFGEYCGFISHPTGPNEEKQKKTVMYVPTALIGAGLYTVLPTLERVDGARCHVVTSGVDTFWLDPANGFCVRRRVQFRQSDLTDPGCLSYIQICKDFKEADNGIFLPTVCQRYSYATQSEPKDTWGRLSKIVTLSVKELKVNANSDAQFDLSFPPGTQVNDLILNRAYLMPNGEENLDKAIAQSQMYIVDGQVLRQVSPLSWRRIAIWGVNGLLLAAIAGVAVVKVLRRRVVTA